MNQQHTDTHTLAPNVVPFAGATTTATDAPADDMCHMYRAVAEILNAVDDAGLRMVPQEPAAAKPSKPSMERSSQLEQRAVVVDITLARQRRGTHTSNPPRPVSASKDSG